MPHVQITPAHDGRTCVSWSGRPMLLADACEMFKHFGLQVADSTNDGGVTSYHCVGPELSADARAAICAACDASLSGAWDIGPDARLITSASIQWRELLVIRAAIAYLRQSRPEFAAPRVVEYLAAAPEFVRSLLALFRTRLDPHEVDDGGVTDSAIEAHLEAAASLAEERIRRGLVDFVRAVLRTNWFQSTVDGRAKAYLSFKLDPTQLALAQDPFVAYREIFVHGAEMSGLHARSGLVARGGLRLSDRPDDFRREVLGLVKTQSVKNAPIVPAGAKGAFVIRRPGTAPATAYRMFICGLLDVTDNIVDGVVQHPADTACRDGDDPYLVVAADKGTARFSDIANDVAAEYGFWLGDAFASGGSAGFDHKAMGITARGAWVSVQRHFAEADIDIATEPFTVIGIGDMSGDVFGNGMLLSRNIKLVGAFDHRHVFIDPDPDPAVSFAQRTRLSTTAGSSWADYDSSAISPGGGVWARTAKSIELSEAARRALGISESSCTPDELVSHLLAAPVDLLWNGGVGTYVRGSDEFDTAAADPANAGVRIRADRLRCRIIGEGGNLGLTQSARVEFARAGGRINTDFIDNAAGVATSDREVNIKLALGLAGIDSPDRDELVAAVIEDVAAQVLADSAGQTLAITLTSAAADTLLARHVRLIENLEDQAGMDRIREGLPPADELAERAAEGMGLSRPEIAVLLAQAKNLVTRELLDSTVPDQPEVAGRLTGYFPDAIAAAVGDRLSAHPLRRQIIATSIADDLINRLGPGTVAGICARIGVGTADVALAYGTVRELLTLDAVWSNTLARSCAERERLQALLEIRELVEHLTCWLLRNRRDRCHDGAAAPIDPFTRAVADLVRS